MSEFVLHQPASGATCPPPGDPRFSDAITVEAWVHIREARAEALQTIVAQWEPLTSFDTFDAYDAGHTSGMDTTGFFGAVFDGRYVYFVPQHDTRDRHGRVLRYDTHGAFRSAASWQAYDAGHTDGMVTKGYYGAVFDGRHVYFVPRREPTRFHARVLRLDTRGEFTDPRSWAAFDGRYIYFCPGHHAVPKSELAQPPPSASPAVTGLSADHWQLGNSVVLRHDTQGEFKDLRSWATFDAAHTDSLECCDYDGAAFDGRYVYFTPLSTGNVLRYDTRGGFQSPASWTAHDIKPLGMKLAVGSVFDGRFLYFVPYGQTEYAVRYDTRGPFAEAGSWSRYRLLDTPGLPGIGFDGGFFDGRFVYFVPYYDGDKFFHGYVLRYDTRGEFHNPASWRATDAGQTGGLHAVGYNAGAFDGRYFYFAAWQDGSSFPKAIVGHGRVLRYDTLGGNGTFSLRWCDYGHNGGLCAALPGARFLVNTEQGARSIAANRLPSAGRHHLAGVYDGRSIRLFLDGNLVNEQAASGRLVASAVPLTTGPVEGEIERIRISDCARGADWLRERARL
jgi:hypothetical protein